MKISSQFQTLFLAITATIIAVPVDGQGKKDEKKMATPRVVVALPLGVVPGTAQKITIRGHVLENASEVKFLSPGVAGKIVSKGKAGVPDKNPEKVGDTQVVVEAKIAGDVAEEIRFVVVTPEGESPPHTLRIDKDLIKEKEPNDGFRTAQEITLPAVVEGTIEKPRDVDVFRFAGTKGQKVHAEVMAARHGSALDGILHLYNSAGNQLAFSDDEEGSLDPRFVFTLPADDQYYLVLIDAHDTGGAIHAYRLLVK